MQFLVPLNCACIEHSLIDSIAGAQYSSNYAMGGGYMLVSNFTTDAITVASAATLCYDGAPGYPVVEATISSVHQVESSTNVSCSARLSRTSQGHVITAAAVRLILRS